MASFMTSNGSLSGYSSSARIAVLQFDPKFCDVQKNVQTAQRLCAKLAPRSVDLICLPEMAFTGYVFKDSSSIDRYLEEPQSGPTSQFCAELAARVQCHVLAGYPERLAVEEIEDGVDSDGNIVTKNGANSAVLYGPDGRFIGNYRKSNLFETDTTWAKAGTGFATFLLPPPLNTVCVGICMDLNVQAPGQWVSLEKGPYEFANYCIAKRADLVILLNAWLLSDEDNENEYGSTTINYWSHRLRPLWVLDEKTDPEILGRQTNVVICNRFGHENGKTFCGSSSLFRMTAGSGRPVIVHMMKKQEEGLSIWTT